MAFLLSWQFLPHDSWKVMFFTASIMSSWNGTVWAEVTITQTPTRTIAGRSIMLSVQSDQKNIFSFTWFRDNKNNRFCIIRPAEKYENCTNQNPGRVIAHFNGSLTLQNLSSRDSGLYLIKVNSLEGKNFWSEKYIQVNAPTQRPFIIGLSMVAVWSTKGISSPCAIDLDPTRHLRVLFSHQAGPDFSSAKIILRVVDQDSPKTSQSTEVNLIFIVSIAVLAGLVITGGLGCILFIRNNKRNSKKQLEDLEPDGKRHVAGIHKVFPTYENDPQSRALHTYENQSQSPVVPTYENNPQARDGMTIIQNQNFASASFSTLSEKPYEEIDASQVDVYDQIIHTRSQGRRKL